MRSERSDDFRWSISPRAESPRPPTRRSARLLGVDGIFVGSGIFKAQHPMKVARAVVEASLHFDDPEILARVYVGAGGSHERGRDLQPALRVPLADPGVGTDRDSPTSCVSRDLTAGLLRRRWS